MTSEKLINSIIEHEGFSSTVYLDSLGKPTIGYGFLVEALEMDKDIGREIMLRKLKKNELTLIRNLEWYRELPEEAKEIIQEMFYQLHYKLFKFVKTLSYIEKHDWASASKEMLDSKWASKDCPKRAEALSERMSKVTCD